MIRLRHRSLNITRTLFAACLAMTWVKPAWAQSASNEAGFSTTVAESRTDAIGLTQRGNPDWSTPQLLEGDVLLAVDGAPVTTPAVLYRSPLCSGSGVHLLDVFRPGQSGYLRVNAYALRLRDCLRLPVATQSIVRPAIVVSTVTSQSFADRYGMKPGDILLSAGNRSLIGSPDELAAFAAQLPSQMVQTPGFPVVFSRNGSAQSPVPGPEDQARSGQAGETASAAASPPVPGAGASDDAVTSDTTDQTNAEAATPQAPADTVTYVQKFLRSKQANHNLTVTGTWDGETQDTVQSFLADLQGRPMWGHAWTGPKDGVYSDDYANYLKATITALKMDTSVDQGEVSRLENFMVAMDELKRQGVYRMQAEPSAQADTSSESPTGVNAGSFTSRLTPFVMSAFFWFSNGALSGFGDEMWCGLMHSPESFTECHRRARTELDDLMTEAPILAMIINFAGVACNLISWVLVVVATRSEGQIHHLLARALLLGVLDSFLFTLGDLFTWGFQHLDFPQIFASAALSAFVFLIVVAKHQVATDRQTHKFSIKHR